MTQIVRDTLKEQNRPRMLTTSPGIAGLLLNGESFQIG